MKGEHGKKWRKHLVMGIICLFSFIAFFIFGTHLVNDTDECFVVPCKNEGVCTDGDNSFSCVCADGWTGTTCDGKLKSRIR